VRREAAPWIDRGEGEAGHGGGEPAASTVWTQRRGSRETKVWKWRSIDVNVCTNLK
jgi:hypothetical protein